MSRPPARSAPAPTRIVLSHILRNVMSPIVVQLTIVFSAAVVAEASLSFLGFGTQPPQPSWGRDMSEARRFLGDAPWMFLAPTAIIMLCVLSINFMGDGLRDALDPRAWRTRRSAGRRRSADAAAQRPQPAHPLRHRPRHRARGQRRVVRPRGRRGAGAGRRKRQRQERDRALDHAPGARAAGPCHRRSPDASTASICCGSARPRRARSAARAWR